MARRHADDQPPVAVLAHGGAQTARVQRAKRMIDNTDLAMTEIALAAGFGSLRRFNTVFAAVYKRPPTAIRRASHTPVTSAA